MVQNWQLKGNQKRCSKIRQHEQRDKRTKNTVFLSVISTKSSPRRYRRTNIVNHRVAALPINLRSWWAPGKRVANQKKSTIHLPDENDTLCPMVTSQENADSSYFVHAYSGAQRKQFPCAEADKNEFLIMVGPDIWPTFDRGVY